MGLSTNCLLLLIHKEVYNLFPLYSGLQVLILYIPVRMLSLTRENNYQDRGGKFPSFNHKVQKAQNRMEQMLSHECEKGIYPDGGRTDCVRRVSCQNEMT